MSTDQERPFPKYLDDQDGNKETDHLLRSPKNARRLMDSIESLRDGEGKKREITE